MTKRGSWGLEMSKYYSCLQEGESGELQAGQSHLDAQKGDGAYNSGNQ